mgnify:CR=1 FL=1
MLRNCSRQQRRLKNCMSMNKNRIWEQPISGYDSEYKSGQYLYHKQYVNVFCDTFFEFFVFTEVHSDGLKLNCLRKALAKRLAYLTLSIEQQQCKK